MKLKFTRDTALVGVALLGLLVWAEWPTTPPPPVDRGWQLHDSVRQFLEAHLRARQRLDLSRPRLDLDTGWEPQGADRWKLWGVARVDGQPFRWEAEVVDDGQRSLVSRLRLGDRLVASNGVWILTNQDLASPPGP